MKPGMRFSISLWELEKKVEGLPSVWVQERDLLGTTSDGGIE